VVKKNGKKEAQEEDREKREKEVVGSGFHR
jgi:hypothetical protein